MKVVLDTNIMVLALIKAGKPRDLFNKLVKRATASFIQSYPRRVP